VVWLYNQQFALSLSDAVATTAAAQKQADERQLYHRDRKRKLE